MSDLKTVRASDVILPRWQTLGTAGFAGMFAWCFAHPFEMWKNTVMMAPRGSNQLECLCVAAKRGLYKGLSGGLARQIVYTTLRLGCYPIFRDTLLRGEVAVGLKESFDPSHINMLDRMVAGAAAGVFASFLSSPVEVGLVLQTTSKEKLSMLGAARKVWQNSGFKGYWRGFGALGSRAALVGVVQVALHDQTLTTLRNHNRMRSKPLNDNIVVNIASVITAFVFGFLTMPVEFSRVRMSAESKLPPTALRRYTNVFQCLARITREEGFRAIYEPFVPYFGRASIHTISCFFVIEYCTRVLKQNHAKARGLVLID